MFEQGTGANNKTSWMEIRTYLISKLLWDVTADVNKIIDEFITGYYGKAAPYIKQYYTLNEQAVNKKTALIERIICFNIYYIPYILFIKFSVPSSC